MIWYPTIHYCRNAFAMYNFYFFKASNSESWQRRIHGLISIIAYTNSWRVTILAWQINYYIGESDRFSTGWRDASQHAVRSPVGWNFARTSHFPPRKNKPLLERRFHFILIDLPSMLWTARPGMNSLRPPSAWQKTLRIADILAHTSLSDPKSSKLI